MVTVVLLDHGGTEPEVMVFEDSGRAEIWAEIRGTAIAFITVEPISDTDADSMIKAEAKERRDEERFDRMRQEGEI